MNWTKLAAAPFLMAIASIPMNAMAQPLYNIQAVPGFSEYANNEFSVQYPSNWVINNTLPEQLLPYQNNNVIFRDPNNTAGFFISWWHNQTRQILDTDYWFKNLTSDGYAVTILDNTTHYLSNNPAIEYLAVKGNLKETGVVTNINGITYMLDYITSVTVFPTYLYSFNVMLEKFHVNGS